MLELRNIRKIYHAGEISETCLFDDFSLTVDDGSFVSVVGSNGSGKTSLLNLICGSVQPDEGSILLDDICLSGRREHRNFARIGRVFQDPAAGTAGTLTVRENLALALGKGGRYGLSPACRRSRDEELRTMLATLGMGLEDRLDARADTLSGGQRQALTLLLATATPIRLLLLDEHTAALDPRAADAVMELTDRIVREKHLTTLMVTHNLRYAVTYGDRLLMLHRGTCVLETAGEEKASLTVDDLLTAFNRISIECGN